jgi:hypothetical protein
MVSVKTLRLVPQNIFHSNLIRMGLGSKSKQNFIMFDIFSKKKNVLSIQDKLKIQSLGVDAHTMYS